MMTNDDATRVSLLAQRYSVQRLQPQVTSSRGAGSAAWLQQAPGLHPHSRQPRATAAA